MHGQKKRRKRTVTGCVRIDDSLFEWRLISEPQWCNSGRGYIGMCVSARLAGVVRRELLVEFPYPVNRAGTPLPIPQRPRIDAAIVEAAIRSAIDDGWDPQSRGKAFCHAVAPRNIA